MRKRKPVKVKAWGVFEVDEKTGRRWLATIAPHRAWARKTARPREVEGRFRYVVRRVLITEIGKG